MFFPNSPIQTGLVYEQRKKFGRPLEMYEPAVKITPAIPENDLRAGAVLKQFKAYPEAAEALERVVALDPKNVAATKQLAVVSTLNLMHGKQQRMRA